MSANVVVVSALIGALTALFVEGVKYFLRRAELLGKLRVETEYAILRELWSKAYWLKSRANQVLNHHTIDVNDEAAREGRLNAFASAWQECRESVFLNRPFYPPEIFKIARELDVETTLKIDDFIDVCSRGPIGPSSPAWNRHKVLNDRIDEIVERLCSAIQRHLRDEATA